MHDRATVELALGLVAGGASATEVARRLGLNRRTVSGWLNGETPSARELCTRCGVSHQSLNLGVEYAYLLGLYLGDGCISTHARGVYRLRISLDAKYPNIVEGAASAVAAVQPRSRVGVLARPSNDIEVSSFSQSWLCAFPQHGPGKKHHRCVALAPWQRDIASRWPATLLRGLVHSDGCRFMNTGRGWRHPRYRFDNLPADIRRIFVDACDDLGVRWTVSGTCVYVSRKADVSVLDEHIGPKS